MSSTPEWDEKSFAAKVLSRLDRLDREQIEAFVASQMREKRAVLALLDYLRDGVSRWSVHKERLS